MNWKPALRLEMKRRALDYLLTHAASPDPAPSDALKIAACRAEIAELEETMALRRQLGIAA